MAIRLDADGTRKLVDHPSRAYGKEIGNDDSLLYIGLLLACVVAYVCAVLLNPQDANLDVWDANLGKRLLDTPDYGLHKYRVDRCCALTYILLKLRQKFCVTEFTVSVVDPLAYKCLAKLMAIDGCCSEYPSHPHGHYRQTYKTNDIL